MYHCVHNVYKCLLSVYTFCSYQSWACVPCTTRVAVPISAASVYQPDTWELHSWNDSPRGAAGAATWNPFCETQLHKVLLCFHLLIVINFCLSVLCIKSDFCIYHISKQVSTIATFVGDSSGCKLRRQLRLRRRLRVWIIAVPQKTSKDEHNLHGCIHWTPLQEPWNTLLILHISASKTKCRQETTETTKFALVIVIDCYSSKNRHSQTETTLRTERNQAI